MDAHHPQPCRHRDRLVRHNPDLAGEPAHLHREAHRWVHGADAPLFQCLNHVPGNVIDLLPAMVEFEVGDRARRCPSSHVKDYRISDQSLLGRPRRGRFGLG